MPIARVASALDYDIHSILNFTSWWMADSSDFGPLGEQSSPKWEDSLPRMPMEPVQNLTPLLLS